MNTKTPILAYFKLYWPEYAFVGEHRPNLVFRKNSENGIYQLLSLQRDSKSCGLTLQLGCTYNPFWKGEPAEPLGYDEGLANLRLKSRCIEVMQHWYFYKPTSEGLLGILDEIKSQFKQLAPRFFEQSRRDLLSNSLLQLALQRSDDFTSEELVGLEEALLAVRYRLADLTHPAYVKLGEILDAAWTPKIEDRMWIKRYAYDSLLLRKLQHTLVAK